MHILLYTHLIMYISNCLHILLFTYFIVDEDEWLDFLELTLADWLEQVEGAAEKVRK